MTTLSRGSRVIVDTSFVRSSPPDGSTFRALAVSGCRLVLIDNMAFELCSTSNQAQWPATQMKLMPCHEAVDCWHYTGVMLRMESEHGRPYGNPFHEETTHIFRDVLRGRARTSPTTSPPSRAKSKTSARIWPFPRCSAISHAVPRTCASSSRMSEVSLSPRSMLPASGS